MSDLNFDSLVNLSNSFGELSTCAIADVLPHVSVCMSGLNPLWQPMPRIAGPAFTVHCPAGDNLMLHAAIHAAPANSVIVVQSDAPHYALAGGNVCMVAQQRGIRGFVLDGVIRDVAELRDARFPVYARGVMPKPGTKEKRTELNTSIICAGVTVHGGDIVVADEEGIVIVPQAQASDLLAKAQAKVAKDASQTLEEWRTAHEAKIGGILEG